MNVFEKLNAARLFFMNANVKMSGYNAFAKYKYFELSDILPAINRAAKEIGFCCIVRFGKEEATLEIVDVEKTEDRIVFASPVAGLDLKSNHPIQNLGAAQTYIRRYLYMIAFEIVECDALDKAAGTQEAPQAKPAAPASAGRKDAPALAQKAEQPPEQAEPSLSNAEMRAEIERILTAVHPDGRLVFSQLEKESWWKRFVARPLVTLPLARKELAARRASWRAAAPQADAQEEEEAERDFEDDDIPF